MSKTAWMLRRGGDAFPVIHHFYVMNDDDLSSEAEVAAFLITTNSNGQDIAKYILDAWSAMLIENKVSYDSTESDIERILLESVQSTPYTFQYPIDPEKILNIHRELKNYSDVDELYEFIDSVRASLSLHQQSIKDVLNQQFCRSRFGGQYNTAKGNKELWFRISSTGYNWINDIYVWTAENYRKLQANTITICRDYESDHGDDESHEEYFYTAKDGSVYRNMPLYEFFSEEHDTNPVFAVTQVNCFDTFKEPYVYIQESFVCVSASTADVIQQYPTRTQLRLQKLCSMILNQNEELSQVDIFEINPRENKKGKMTASEIVFECMSEIPELNGLKISIILNRGIKDTTINEIVRKFRIEFSDYKKFKHII